MADGEVPCRGPRSRRGAVSRPLGARRMLSYRPSGRRKLPCDGNPQYIRRRAPNARGSIGESTCLRSRRLQVRVLPGVLCPKRKWAMRRDVDPEEAGSSPAGHPAVQRAHAEYAVPPRLWPNWERRLA